MLRDELIRVTYSMERILWQDPDPDGLDVWSATLQVGTLTKADVERADVATATLLEWIRIGTHYCEAPFDVADAHSGDTAYYYEHASMSTVNCSPTSARSLNGWRAEAVPG